MVGWSDEGWGTKKAGGGGGPGVTEYATIAELVTASEGSLAPGYYEVVGQWLTRWDGAQFTPGGTILAIDHGPPAVPNRTIIQLPAPGVTEMPVIDP